eukprot:946828-Pyramimonas_sp.AAC.2
MSINRLKYSLHPIVAQHLTLAVESDGRCMKGIRKVYERDDSSTCAAATEAMSDAAKWRAELERGTTHAAEREACRALDAVSSIPMQADASRHDRACSIAHHDK